MATVGNASQASTGIWLPGVRGTGSQVGLETRAYAGRLQQWVARPGVGLSVAPVRGGSSDFNPY